MVENFQCTTSFVENGITITKYVSTKTGLRVVHADIEGPLVEGAFVLATEAHDDDGCPHTLEHLIFLGSELYPYKGILDGLANRCLAQGTNAWTDVDHTAYTLTTAGQEGFLNLLPIFLDHILYPTLTDSGFYTEVHHITGEGEDAGVVYCEMQGRENSSSSLVYRNLLRTIYPEDSGYRYETGGIMANIRSLKVDKIRQYHRDFYRPDNLCLIVSGKVNKDDLFNTLAPFENRILSKGELPPLKKPWTTQVPPYSQNNHNKVPFPSDDDTTGLSMLAWRGPKYHDFDEITGMRVMWKYLTDSAISPLYKLFVEIENPYCTDIYHGDFENYEFTSYCRFENVPTDKLPEIKDIFFKEIDSIVSKGVDMTRINDMIDKSILERYNQIEEKPHPTIQFLIIGHFLYGKDDKELQIASQEIERLKSLKSKDNSYWTYLIKKYIIDRPYVFIEGIPSPQLGDQLAETESKRTEKQRLDLGDEKLKNLKIELEEATKKNDTPIPDEIMTQFKVPDVTKIPFIPVKTIRNDKIVTNDKETDKLYENLPRESIPYFVQFDHVTSAFVQLRAIFDTSSIPDHLRDYLEIFMDIFFELPIRRGDQLIKYEDVIAELSRDTVSYSSSLGFGSGSRFSCGSWSQSVVIDLKAEKSKYQKIVKWLSELIWSTEFTPEKLKININKLLNDIPNKKRQGPVVAKSLINELNYDKNKSNQIKSSIIYQQNFLTSLVKKIESDPNGIATIINDLNELRNSLLHPNNLRIQVVADLTSVNDPKSPLIVHLVPSKFQQVEKKVVPNILPAINARDSSKKGKGYIAGIASIENSFLSQSGSAPSSFGHDDEAPLLVLIEYLTGMEGLFWKKIRGLGLAYGYSIVLRVEEGLIYFALAKSSNVTKAYSVSMDIVKDLVSKTIPIDNVRLEAAKSGVIFSVVSREENMESAALQSLLNHIKQVGPNGNKDLLERVQNVKMDDIYRVLNLYINSLFDESITNLSIVTNSSKVDEIIQGFSSMKRTLSEYQL